MSYFFSKMNSETLGAMTADGTLEIPNPKKSEGTPIPQPGDIMFAWDNERGLVFEAVISAVEPAERPIVRLVARTDYPQPRLDDGWLYDRKGKTHEPIDSLCKRLGSSRTERGGTILLVPDEVAELDAARRQLLSQHLMGEG